MAYLGGASAVNKDILPFSIAQGNWALCRVPNSVGIERAGFPGAERLAIAKAVKAILRGTETMDDILARIESEFGESQEVRHILNFVRASKKGIAK
jgi:UDP-N-acetylglucosamine acyltransferase